MKTVMHEGSYRCKVVSWGARAGKNGSQSLGVSMQCQIFEAWNHATKSWDDWRGYEPTGIYVDTYPIGSDGEVNETGVDQLVKSIAWTGDMLMFDTPPPDDLVVVVDAREETYTDDKGPHLTVRGRWLNPGDHTPGSGGRGIARKMDRESLEKANAALGAKLRAAAGAAAVKAIETPF